MIRKGDCVLNLNNYPGLVLTDPDKDGFVEVSSYLDRKINVKHLRKLVLEEEQEQLPIPQIGLDKEMASLIIKLIDMSYNTVDPKFPIEVEQRIVRLIYEIYPELFNEYQYLTAQFK